MSVSSSTWHWKTLKKRFSVILLMSIAGAKDFYSSSALSLSSLDRSPSAAGSSKVMKILLRMRGPDRGVKSCNKT